jgi:YgiT-type zinc finger domain-containing protein
MTDNKANSFCPLCGGNKQAGNTTYTVDTGKGVVVIRNVPALICGQCGEEWIEDPVAQQIEKIVADASQRHAQVEVLALE